MNLQFFFCDKTAGCAACLCSVYRTVESHCKIQCHCCSACCTCNHSCKCFCVIRICFGSCKYRDICCLHSSACYINKRNVFALYLCYCHWSTNSYRTCNYWSNVYGGVSIHGCFYSQVTCCCHVCLIYCRIALRTVKSECYCTIYRNPTCCKTKAGHFCRTINCVSDICGRYRNLTTYIRFWSFNDISIRSDSDICHGYRTVNCYCHRYSHTCESTGCTDYDCLCICFQITFHVNLCGRSIDADSLTYKCIKSAAVNCYCCSCRSAHCTGTCRSCCCCCICGSVCTDFNSSWNIFQFCSSAYGSFCFCFKICNCNWSAYTCNTACCCQSNGEHGSVLSFCCYGYIFCFYNVTCHSGIGLIHQVQWSYCYRYTCNTAASCYTDHKDCRFVTCCCCIVRIRFFYFVIQHFASVCAFCRVIFQFGFGLLGRTGNCFDNNIFSCWDDNIVFHNSLNIGVKNCYGNACANACIKTGCQCTACHIST